MLCFDVSSNDVLLALKPEVETNSLNAPNGSCRMSLAARSLNYDWARFVSMIARPL